MEAAEAAVISYVLDPEIVRTLAPGILDVAEQYMLGNAQDAENAKLAEDIRRGFALLKQGYQITNDGHVVVRGSSGSYVNSGDWCLDQHTKKPCRGMLSAKKKNGACYHCLCFEGLCVAQAFATDQL